MRNGGRCHYSTILWINPIYLGKLKSRKEHFEPRKTGRAVSVFLPVMGDALGLMIVD